MAGTSIIREDLPIPGGLEALLPAANLTLAGTPYYATDTGRLFRCRDDGSAWDVLSEPIELALERAMVIGKGGTLLSLGDTADFPLVVPFDLTLRRMKVICATAPATSMTVQLRISADNVTPTYSDVTGFLVTFVSGEHTAIVDPSDVAVTEGSVLNLSLGSASGSNMLVEIVGVAR